MSIGNSIARLFGRSPIRPLLRHYETVHASVAELEPYFQAAIANDWEEGRAIRERIVVLENEADDMKREFRLNLPKHLFLHMPRTDLLELMSIQDRVANKSKDITGLMLGREMSIPEPLAEPILAYIRSTINTSAQARTALNELDVLMETGFAKREIKLIENMVEVLDDIEGETDDLQVQVRSILFGIEKELHPVDVMFLYKIIEWIGELSDRAHKVGGYLHRLVAR
ncbi:MAG TPA: TIGR00153 family protein [Alcanivoracaceae bacterium]|nr:TIGR00153 family protein [Alcanivoracaceae bacterium]